MDDDRLLVSLLDAIVAYLDDRYDFAAREDRHEGYRR
jgi:hypothetical protein